MFYRHQRIRSIDISIGFACSTKISHAAIQQCLSSGNTVVHEDAVKQKAYMIIHDSIGSILCFHREIHIIIQQFFITIIEFFKTGDVFHFSRFHITKLVLSVHRIDTFVHINRQDFQQIDADVRRSRTLSPQDKFRTSERYISFCCLFIHAHTVSHRRNVNFIII